MRAIFVFLPAPWNLNAAWMMPLMLIVLGDHAAYGALIVANPGDPAPALRLQPRR